MSHTGTHFELLEGFGKEGCPVCRLTLDAVRHYLESANYELVADHGFRRQTRDALGFCNQHAYQWHKVADRLATAVLYDDVLDRVQAELRRARFRKGDLLAGVAALLHPGQANDCSLLTPEALCPACQYRQTWEGFAIQEVLQGLAEPEFRAAYEDSAGLCLHHLRLALCQAPDAATFAVLRDAALWVEEKLSQQLHEIVRKHDYRFKDEPKGEEWVANVFAIAHVAGMPGSS